MIVARLPIGYRVEFRIPRPVASSKNRRRIFRRGRKLVSLPSRQASTDLVAVAGLAQVAARGVRFHPLDALSLDVIHHLHDETVTVCIEKVGELPAKGKRGTKRDAHGMIETIADALQGVLYENDSSIDAGSWQRDRRNP